VQRRELCASRRRYTPSLPRSGKVDSLGTFVKVMRWAYASPHGRLVCEVALDASQLLYVFRVHAPDGQGSAIRELYGDVAGVFERQSAYEAELLSSGYSLEAFGTTEEELPAGQNLGL
jgi:hypothetical protein